MCDTIGFADLHLGCREAGPIITMKRIYKNQTTYTVARHLLFQTNLNSDEGVLENWPLGKMALLTHGSGTS